MKKLLFFIPTLGGGGAERVLVNLVNNLNKSKYEITVKTLFDTGANKQYLDKYIKYEYVFKNLFRGNVMLLKLFSPECLYNRMIKDKYDIVVSYLQSPTMRIVTGCKDSNTKLISWIHNEFHDEKALAKLYRNNSEFISSMNKYNKIVFVAKSAESALTTALPMIKSKSITIYNTVESDEIRLKADEPLEVSYPADKINLVSVGRFAKQKAFHRLINIAYRLNKEGYNVHLSLLGDGELKGEYLKQIEKLGIQTDVTFLGYRDNPYKYVKKADLFVCSSLYEGFSTAVTEALIVGTPVVTTSCSGMEELLGKNGEYGIITVNNENALFEGIKTVLEDNRIAELRSKASIGGKRFDKDSTIIQTERFFDNL